MEVTIKVKTYEMRYTFRAMLIYEKITDKSFSPQGLSDVLMFFYSTILAVDKDIEFSFDEFLDFCDENPNLVAEFADWLTRVITQQAATTNKQIDENELKKTSKKAKKAANSN